MMNFKLVFLPPMIANSASQNVEDVPMDQHVQNVGVIIEVCQTYVPVLQHNFMIIFK